MKRWQKVLIAVTSGPAITAILFFYSTNDAFRAIINLTGLMVGVPLAVYHFLLDD